MSNIIVFPASRTNCSDAPDDGAVKAESKLPELQHMERLRDLMQAVHAAVMTVHSEVADINATGGNCNRDLAEEDYHAPSQTR